MDGARMLNLFGAITVDQPALLLLLAVLAPLAAVLAYAARRARGDLRALCRVAALPAAGASPDAVLRLKRGADGALTCVAAVCLILGAADLRWGAGRPAPRTSGGEVVLLIDLSRSMAAADAPPSRLRQGLAAAGDLVDALPGAPVAVVGFSDASHVLLPFTDDRHALRQHLAALDAQAPALGGSQLTGALHFACFELPGSPAAARTVVLVSDGEGGIGDPLAAARQAGRAGTAIVTVPVGTAAGAPVPEAGSAPAAPLGSGPAGPAGQGEGSGRSGQSGKADAPAGRARSARDEHTMREIARLSGGVLADPLLPDTMAAARAYLQGSRDAARDRNGVSGTITRRPRYATLALIALLALAGCAAVRAVRWRATF